VTANAPVTVMKTARTTAIVTATNTTIKVTLL
jgi:hypothetical protein